MKMKKLISAISTLTILVSGVGNILAVQAADTAYSQDFSDVTDASTVATSNHAQDMLVISADDTHGNYLSFDFSATSINSRGAYMDFEGIDMSAEEYYVIEFDAAITPGNDRFTAFAIKDTDFAYISNNINYGAESGYIINLVGTVGTEEYILNDTTTVTIPSGEWCHYTLYVNKEKGTVSTTIIGETSRTIANEIITSYDGKGNVAGLYMLAGRYNPVISVDNIVVNASGIGDETEYTINYILDGTPLFSDIMNGYIGKTVYAETTLLLNSVKYLALDGIETSMTLIDGENILNVPIGKATDYTVNYILNEEVISSVKGTKAVGSVITAENSVTVGNMRYYITDDAETSMTLVDGENVLNVTVREEQKFDLTVSAIGDVEKTLSTTEDIIEGENVSYAYSKYILDGTTLYSTVSGSEGYRGTISAISKDTNVALTYTKASDGKFVYYSEAEDIKGAMAFTSTITWNDTAKLCSNSVAALFPNNSVIATTLVPGKYKITAGVWGRLGYSHSVMDAIIVGDNKLTLSTTGGISENVSDELTITEDTDVVISKWNSASILLDYIMIEQTGTVNVGTADENGEVTVLISDAYTNYKSDTNKATGFTAKFTNIGSSMRLVQELTWIITPENADGVEVSWKLDTIMSLKSGASATVGIVLDGLYDENATANVKIE